MGTNNVLLFRFLLTNHSITLWYRRHECGSRIAIFFSAATAAGAFGGLLARGIMEMDGIAGLNGWAWIFILEGILTVIVGESEFSSSISLRLTYSLTDISRNLLQIST